MYRYDAFAQCSAAAWSTLDGKHLFARNFDHTGISKESGVMYVPQGYSYTAAEKGSTRRAKYSVIGMGMRAGEKTFAVYDGMNERGLAGAQLYYREFARYKHCEDKAAEVQPPLLTYHMLASCSDVNEVADAVRSRIILSDTPMLGTTPPLHWLFCDSKGKTAIIEPDIDGVKVYTETAGVMTNSPPYPWHMLNMLNYAGIDCKDKADIYIGGEKTKRCFSGSGAIGLPGDWSSPARFVRLSHMLRLAVKGKNEEQGIAYFMRLMCSVAFPLGMVEVADQECITRGLPPYDYTVYTSIMCSESLKYYWNTYEDMKLRSLSLDDLKSERCMKIYPL